MFELPIGKGITAVESGVQCNFECLDENQHYCSIDCCTGCYFVDEETLDRDDNRICACLCCIGKNRKDGKNVVYQLIDLDVISY